jgi:hypothetical protein
MLNRSLFTTVVPLGLVLVACPVGKPAEEAKIQAGASAASQPAPKAAASRPTGATQPAAAASQPAVKSDPFSGLVKLGNGLTAADIKATDVLFVMARQAMGPGQAGRLVAVQRHAPAKLPLRYEMNSKNLMMPGVPFSGPFIVRARLDRDGDPMTKGADDLYAEFSKNVNNGDEGIHLVLAKKAAAPAPAPRSRPAVAPKAAPKAAPASQPAQ